MNIKKEHLEILWYENEAGDKYFPPMNELSDYTPAGFVYQHSRLPCVLTHNVLRFVLKHEVDGCEHPPEHIAKTYGWIDCGLRFKETLAN